jgi:hypothetical protein
MITEIAFGKAIGSLKKPVSFSKAFNMATLASDYRFRYPWYKVRRAPDHAHTRFGFIRMFDAHAHVIVIVHSVDAVVGDGEESALVCARLGRLCTGGHRREAAKELG